MVAVQTLGNSSPESILGDRALFYVGAEALRSSMMSRIVFTAFATLLLMGCNMADPVTLGTLIEHHTESRGGAEAIEDVRSLRLDLEITEPGFTVRGDYIATRDGYMRIDIYAGDERVFTEALGPDGGWQLLRGETVATGLSADGETALRRGLIGNLYGLHELSALGYELSFAGLVTQGVEEFWAIDQVAPNGFSKRRFFDKASFLIARETETSALHPDLDSTRTRQETMFVNYRVSAGVLFPRQSQKINSATGEIVQTVVVKSVQVNPEIDTAEFKPLG
jgi:hypothetical protein